MCSDAHSITLSRFIIEYSISIIHDRTPSDVNKHVRRFRIIRYELRSLSEGEMLRGFLTSTIFTNNRIPQRKNLRK